MATTDTSKFNIGAFAIGVGATAAILFVAAWALSKGWATGKK